MSSRYTPRPELYKPGWRHNGGERIYFGEPPEASVFDWNAPDWSLLDDRRGEFAGISTDVFSPS